MSSIRKAGAASVKGEVALDFEAEGTGREVLGADCGTKEEGGIDGVLVWMEEDT